MGLNLNKLAELSKQVAPIGAPKAEVSAALVSLEDLKKLSSAVVPAATPVESAGTINFHQVSGLITELDGTIKANHPRMPGLLQDIWNTLEKYPECVTLLSEEEMEIVISGLEKVVDTDLAASTLKSATSGSKGKKAPVSAASLGF